MAKVVQVLCWCLIISLNFAQDCKTPGVPCNDDKQCCGGCCIEGICTSTYQNCEAIENSCEENYCAEGFECYMYKPLPSCIGCEPHHECREFKDPGPGHF